jgi:hypothetical protein
MYFYNISYTRGRDRKSDLQGHPGKKLVRPYLKNKPGMVAHAYYPSYSESKGRRLWVQGQFGQMYETLTEKQTKSTKVGM